MQRARCFEDCNVAALQTRAQDASRLGDGRCANFGNILIVATLDEGQDVIAHPAKVFKGIRHEIERTVFASFFPFLRPAPTTHLLAG